VGTAPDVAGAAHPGIPLSPRRLEGWLNRHVPLYRRRSLASLAHDLRACADVLTGQAAATEPEFLALGGDLRTLYDQSTALAQAVDTATTRVHTNLTAHRIGGPDGVVAQALQSVKTSVVTVDAMLQRLRTMTDGLLAMGPEMDRIGRVGVLLQTVAVGFAIDSSRTTECQQAFGSFVDEIRSLSRRTSEVVQRISEELAQASGEEVAALHALEQELAALRNLGLQLETTTSRTAAEVQDRMNDIVAIMGTMRERSVLIQHHTEDAVFHMQFGDIVRQKIEHTGDALREAAERLATRGPHARRSAAEVDNALAVQSGQLAMVEEELATAQRQLGQSFSRISESSASLVAPPQGDTPEGGRGTTGMRALLEDFVQLQELVTNGDRLRLRADKSGEKAFATAERIASQLQEVQSINREMHLLALNAIVKTAALGESGATLEVLSMQVHGLYREADGAVSEIVAMARRLGSAQGEAAAAAEDHAATGHPLIAVVDQVRHDVGDYLTTTAALGEQVIGNRGKLEETASRLDALDRFSRQMQALRDRLDASRSTLAQLFGPALAQARRAETTLDDARYTMQSEREVHQRIAVGATALAPAGGAPVAPPAPGIPQSAMAGAETAKAAPVKSDMPAASNPPWSFAPSS